MITLACGVTADGLTVSVVLDDDGELLVTVDQGGGLETTQRLGREAVAPALHRFQDAQRVDAAEEAA